MALTARPCHPCLGAARAQHQGAGPRWPRSTRAQGRAALGPCAVCASTRPASTASQHTASQHTASQHTASVCHVCHCGRMAHMTHTCARVGDVGDVCHHFRFEVAPQTWKSYTIHTVIIYSIYIFQRPIHLMTHMTHNGGFSEGKIRDTPSPTTPPTPTHTY